MVYAYRHFLTQPYQTYTTGVGSRSWVAPRHILKAPVFHRDQSSWCREFLLTIERTNHLRNVTHETERQSFVQDYLLFSSLEPFTSYSLSFASLWQLPRYSTLFLNSEEYPAGLAYSKQTWQPPYTPLGHRGFYPIDWSTGLTFDHYYVSFDQAYALDPLHNPETNTATSSHWSLVINIEQGDIPFDFGSVLVNVSSTTTVDALTIVANQRWFWPNALDPRVVYIVNQANNATEILRYPINNLCVSWCEPLRDQHGETETIELAHITCDQTAVNWSQTTYETLVLTSDDAWVRQERPLLFSTLHYYKFALLNTSDSEQAGYPEILVLQNAATGFATATLYRGATIISKSFVTATRVDGQVVFYGGSAKLELSSYVPRGILPRRRLNLNDNTIQLKDIASALLGCIALEQSEEIVAILNEVVYVWGIQLGNLNVNEMRLTATGQGVLPAEFTWQPAATTVNYSTAPRYAEDVAWLVFGISKALQFLADRPLGEQSTFEQNQRAIQLCLYHHAYFLARLLVPDEGRLYTGVNAAGLIDTFSNAATVLTLCAFLEYLTIEFDLYIATAAVFIEDRVDNLLYDLPTADPSALVYLLFYAYQRKLYRRVNPICTAYATAVGAIDLANAAAVERHAVFAYLQSRFTDVVQFSETQRQRWSPRRFWCTVDGSLFERKGSAATTAYLWESTWNLLAFRNVPLVHKNHRVFWTYKEEALAYIEYIYQLMQSMWPFGYDWTHASAEQRFKGNIGNLFHTFSRQFVSWYIAYAVQRDSRTLSKAQAFALDMLYQGMNLPSNPFVSDSYKRATYAPLIETDSRAELEKLYRELFGYHYVHIHEPRPTYYTYNTSAFSGDTLLQEEDWSLVPQLETLDLTFSVSDLTRIAAGAGFPSVHHPGFYAAANAFQVWNELMPKASLYVFCTHVHHLDRILERTVPLGHGVNIKLTSGFYEVYAPFSEVVVTCYDLLRLDRLIVSASPETVKSVFVAVSNTPQPVSQHPRRLYTVYAVNPNSEVAYLKFYETLTPVVGTTAPAAVLMIPANGSILLNPSTGWRDFSPALSIACVIGLEDTSATPPAIGLYVEIYA